MVTTHNWSFATQRLASLDMHSAAGADLLHESVRSLLKGLENETEGRHPRPKDLADLAAFVAYFRKAIVSAVKDVARRERNDTHGCNWTNARRKVRRPAKLKCQSCIFQPQ